MPRVCVCVHTLPVTLARPSSPSSARALVSVSLADWVNLQCVHTYAWVEHLNKWISKTSHGLQYCMTQIFRLTQKYFKFKKHSRVILWVCNIQNPQQTWCHLQSETSPRCWWPRCIFLHRLEPNREKKQNKNIYSYTYIATTMHWKTYFYVCGQHNCGHRFLTDIYTHTLCLRCICLKSKNFHINGKKWLPVEFGLEWKGDWSLILFCIL